MAAVLSSVFSEIRGFGVQTDSVKSGEGLARGLRRAGASGSASFTDGYSYVLR